MSLNFKEQFDEFAKTKVKVWQHDRMKTVGASESFQCIRRNYYTKSGTPQDPEYADSYGATERGTLLEANYVVPMLRASIPAGAELFWTGDEQITLVKGLLSATPDGLLKDIARDSLTFYGIADIEADCILVEIKTFDPRLGMKEPKPVHVGQVQQQMGLVHDTTNHKPEYAVILYVNASWLDDIRVFCVKRDPAIYDAAKTRASMVYAASTAKELVAEGKLKGGSECDYCPFAVQCNIVQVGRVPAAAGSGTVAEAAEVVLRELVKTEREASAIIKAETLKKDTAAEAIKDFMAEQGQRFVETSDGYSASFTYMKGRKTYDMAALVEATGIDLEPFTKIGAPSTKLTVKVPKIQEAIED